MKKDKIRVCFVCHGNICRSTMAEFLFRRYVELKKEQDKFVIRSLATSDEELGNPVHYGTRKILDRFNIDYSNKRAERANYTDYDKFDYFVCMDARNVRNLTRIFNGDSENKIKLMLNFVGESGEVADPYFTHDFEATFNDINRCLEPLYKFLTEN